MWEDKGASGRNGYTVFKVILMSAETPWQYSSIPLVVTDVTAVIFVAAVSEYDQVLFEDDETNRLIEAVGLFKQIVNYECFKDKTSMILFLNKSDLLLKKVCDKRPLSLCVEDYKGPNTYAAACELFKDMFSAQVTNALTQKLYTHVTCATDTDQIRTVFLSVKDILLQQSLMNSGLIE